MSKRVTIISASPRIHGNSDLLCDEFARGASDAGNDVEKIFLGKKKINFCRACYYCRDHGDGVCAIKDDMAEILDKIESSDVIVLASPIYFYSIDGQLKTFIDRCLARWQIIRGKEFYFIMTSAEDSARVMDCALECMRGLVVCLKDCVERGVIYGKGVYERGEIKNSPVMLEAYEMGSRV